MRLSCDVLSQSSGTPDLTACCFLFLRWSHFKDNPIILDYVIFRKCQHSLYFQWSSFFLCENALICSLPEDSLCQGTYNVAWCCTFCCQLRWSKKGLWLKVMKLLFLTHLSRWYTPCTWLVSCSSHIPPELVCYYCRIEKGIVCTKKTKQFAASYWEHREQYFRF